MSATPVVNSKMSSSVPNVNVYNPHENLTNGQQSGTAPANSNYAAKSNKGGSSVVTSNTLVSKAPGGGSGAADHALKVFGDMSAQRAGTDGSIAKNGGGVVPNALQGILPSGGVGLTEALVPVVLVLANNATTKRALRSSGVSQKVINKALPSGGENMPPQLTEGGSLANTIAIPAGLFLASHMVAKSARRTGKNFRKSRKQSDNRRSRRYRRRRR
jgi:hypothetical protein